MPQTLDQQRAKHAWNVVQKVYETRDRNHYETEVKKLPTRIISSGLGPALAFLEAKQRAPQLVDAVNNWIRSRRPDRQNSSLTERIMNEDSGFLRFATSEALSYLQWLVRFSEAKGLTKEQED